MKMSAGLGAYLKVRSDPSHFCIPEYWSMRSETSATRTICGEVLPPFCINMTSDNETFKALERLVTVSWDPNGYKGIGRTGCKQIKVESVWQIENMSLYKKYYFCYAHMCGETVEKKQSMAKGLPGGKDVITRKLGNEI